MNAKRRSLPLFDREDSVGCDAYGRRVSKAFGGTNPSNGGDGHFGGTNPSDGGDERFGETNLRAGLIPRVNRRNASCFQ